MLFIRIFIYAVVLSRDFIYLCIYFQYLEQINNHYSEKIKNFSFILLSFIFFNTVVYDIHRVRLIYCNDFGTIKKKQRNNGKITKI